jgi:hypothetical protein
MKTRKEKWEKKKIKWRIAGIFGIKYGNLDRAQLINMSQGQKGSSNHSSCENHGNRWDIVFKYNRETSLSMILTDELVGTTFMTLTHIKKPSVICKKSKVIFFSFESFPSLFIIILIPFYSIISSNLPPSLCLFLRRITNQPNQLIIRQNTHEHTQIQLSPFISSVIPDSTATTISPVKTFRKVPKNNIKSFGVEQIKVSLPPEKNGNEK